MNQECRPVSVGRCRLRKIAEGWGLPACLPVAPGRGPLGGGWEWTGPFFGFVSNCMIYSAVDLTDVNRTVSAGQPSHARTNGVDYGWARVELAGSCRGHHGTRAHLVNPACSQQPKVQMFFHCPVASRQLFPVLTS